MVSQNMASNAVFDNADWLLGEDTSSQKSRPKKHRKWWSIAMATTGVAFCVWPMIASQRQQNQLVAAVESSTTPLEKSQSLDALSEMLPASMQRVTELLASEDSDTSRMSYRALNDYLDKLSVQSDAERQSQTLEMTRALEKQQSKLAGEPKQLASKLASRIFAFAIAEDTNVASQIVDRAEALLTSRPSQKAPSVVTISDVHQLASQFQRFALIDPPASNPNATNLPNLLTVSSILNDYLEFQASSSRDGLDSQTMIQDVPCCQETLPSLAAWNKLDLAERRPKFTKSNLIETSYLAQRSPSESESIFSSMDTSHVVRLLSSERGDAVRNAADELVRRGMTSTQLKFAFDLATGTEEDRIRALDRLPATEIANPIPFYVWMAKDGQQTVRLKAVNDLAKLGTSEAFEQLRELSQNERDQIVSSRIDQLLDNQSRSIAYRNP
jgi:hypothetical protein